MLPYLRHISKRRLLDFVHPVCSFDFNMIFALSKLFISFDGFLYLIHILVDILNMRLMLFHLQKYSKDN